MDSLRPFVSVVIPTYNRPYPLAELLEALSRQTYRHFEVIIVNDGGIPVHDVAALYPELDICLIDRRDNEGHVAARNEGVKAARGEFIMLCDDDDLVLPCHLERMVTALRDADFAYADAEIVQYRTENDRRIPSARFLFAYEYDLEAMRTFSTYVPSGSVYRKSAALTRLSTIIGTGTSFCGPPLYAASPVSRRRPCCTRSARTATTCRDI